MKNGKTCIAAAFAAVLCSLHAFCLDLETDFRRDIAQCHIRPDQARSLKRDSIGTAVSESQLKDAAQSFYDRLYSLDPAFLKRFKIREVVFKDTVYDSDGKTYQNRMIGGDLYLDADLDDKQFYVNMFYLQLPVMPRIYLNRWNNLNPDGFSYENSRGSLSGQAQKKLDAVLAEWDKHFVSRTGMYSTEMDMALTFAYMVTKGPDATAFVRENSPTVEKKFDLVNDILESVKAVEPGYMQTLMAEELSKLKTYSPHALSVRFFHVYSGEWSANEAATPESEAPKRKIGDPVEVAGRKVVPLILALETNDIRLIRLLLENKADPNVVDAKKVSALVLAIQNNDPEQVKLLLEAGAKVTPEAARAGTASGVNAEIVKLMYSYLPGVRQSDAPEKTAEKKKTGKTAAASNHNESEDSGTALYKRLNKVKINHVELEKVDLAKVVQLLQTKSRELDPGGGGIRISFPQKFAGTPVTVTADNVSLYDVLRLVCENAGLKLLMEDPDIVVLSGSGSKQSDAGKKNGSGK